MATLLEDEAIMTSASSGDVGHKANFLPLIRKPRSHTLPWLRAASWPRLGGNPKGAQEWNPGEDNLQWSKRHPFLRLRCRCPFLGICPSKRGSLATPEGSSAASLEFYHSFYVQRFVARSFHGIPRPAPSALGLCV